VEPGATAETTNPYAPPSPFAPPPPPSPSPSTGAADVHLIINVVLIVGGTLFGVFALLFQLLQLTGLADPPSGPPANADAAYAQGYAIGRLLFAGMALVAFVGGPIVAYGLLARRSWGATWARNYWLLTLFSCCLTLPAIYGLVSTTRPGFKALFERRAG